MNNAHDRRVAIVTGAGSGIGRSAAIKLLSEGFAVVLAGRRIERLQETIHQSSADSTAALAVGTDVSNSKAVRELFTATKSQFGRLDVLFNNAGANVPATPLEELTFEQWTSVMDVNVTGMFLCLQQAFHLMKEQQPMGGRIINNGSISAYTPRVHSSAYTASKHAVAGLTKCASLEGRKYNIACGQIDIGNVQTDINKRTGDGALQADGSVAVEPYFDVRHVADAVAYMANLPIDANVQFMTIMATNMPYIGRG